jgi:hypothetical protein
VTEETHNLKRFQKVNIQLFKMKWMNPTFAPVFFYLLTEGLQGRCDVLKTAVGFSQRHKVPNG